jgi:hypothetical protein
MTQTEDLCGPFAFTTACTTFTARYTQDFENAGALPVCWSQGGDEDWRFDNTGAGNHIGADGAIKGSITSGGYFAWVDDSTPDAVNAELLSALVDVSGLTIPALSFYEISDNKGFVSATLEVSDWYVATCNTVGTYNTNTPGWEQKVIDLSGLTFTGPAQARFLIADALATTIDPPAGGTIWCWDRDDIPASGSGDLQGMTITSSDASGCITFVFTSDGSVQREGWEAIVSCDMLNVNQFDATTAFTYYPNPVKNELTLNAKNAIKNVVVLSMLGQEVLVIATNAVNSTINMNKLSQGAYFVKVTIGNVTETIRVIKR